MKKLTILSVFLAFIFCNSIGHAITTLNVSPMADTFIKDDHMNENEGTTNYMRIQHAGESRLLIKFGTIAMTSALAGRPLLAARLRLYVETNWNNWGTDGTILDVHRVNVDWTETGATWNCPNDTNLNNTNPDCGTQWGGGNYQSTATYSLLQTNSSGGYQDF